MTYEVNPNKKEQPLGSASFSLGEKKELDKGAQREIDSLKLSLHTLSRYKKNALLFYKRYAVYSLEPMPGHFKKLSAAKLQNLTSYIIIDKYSHKVFFNKNMLSNEEQIDLERHFLSNHFRGEWVGCDEDNFASLEDSLEKSQDRANDEFSRFFQEDPQEAKLFLDRLERDPFEEYRDTLPYPELSLDILAKALAASLARIEEIEQTVEEYREKEREADYQEKQAIIEHKDLLKDLIKEERRREDLLRMEYSKKEQIP